MSPENPTPPAQPSEHPRVFTVTTVLGGVCFGAGLLALVAGILLAMRGLLTGDAASGLVGILLVLVGIGVNITGLVLLYRGATGHGRRQGK